MDPKTKGDTNFKLNYSNLKQAEGASFEDKTEAERVVYYLSIEE